MSAQSTLKPQQARLFTNMIRRKVSVIPTPSTSTSTALSLTPPPTSLMQENDELAQENHHLRKRNEELIQQSKLNQDLFPEISRALRAKECEIADLEKSQKELKERIHLNDHVSSETIHSLRLQIEGLAEQLAEAQEMATKPPESLSTNCTDEQHQQDLDDLAAAHFAQLREKNKTIHFLRCREARSYRRIDRLKEKLAAAEVLSRD